MQPLKIYGIGLKSLEFMDMYDWKRVGMVSQFTFIEVVKCRLTF
jgi:hypothetical protein